MIGTANLCRLFTLGLFVTASLAQPGGGPGRRYGGPAMGHDEEHGADMELIHFLLDNRDLIRRSVENLPNGVETRTESDDPGMSEGIRKHIRSMIRRLKENRPIHLRDPLFREIFSHSDQILMVLEDTENGARVRETSEDPQVSRLIQEHARVVSLFLANGRAEVHKNHSLP